MNDSDQTQPTEASANGRSSSHLPDQAVAGSSPTAAPNNNDSPIPFENLRAPLPTIVAPPLGARVLAFAGILVGGLLGGLIGYGTADLMSGRTVWNLVGLLVGAVTGAVGVGIVSGLTLRAMNEWQASTHPEAEARAKRSRRKPALGPTDRDGFELRPHLGADRRRAGAQGRRAEGDHDAGAARDEGDQGAGDGDSGGDGGDA